jgi:sarcosine oxidase, subunit gamma
MDELRTAIRHSVLEYALSTEADAGFVRPVGAAARLSLRTPVEIAWQLGSVAGLRLDGSINSCHSSGEAVVARLGPDEWLLIGPEAQLDALARQIRKPSEGVWFHLVDISHRNVGIEVSGPHAKEILNGGCALDLTDPAFPAGSATRTLFGKAEIILIRRVDDSSYRVECGRSFAPYVYGLLKDIALEFGNRQARPQ